MPSRLLVSGASGNLGRAVLGHLLDTLAVEPGRIIATTRSPETLAPFAARGIEVRQADFADTTFLPAAFSGAERMLLISTGSLENRAAEHKAAVGAAKAAGVGFLAYTSIADPDDATPPFFRDHIVTESAIEASGIPSFAILRNNWYFENLAWAIPTMLKTGEWITATGNGRTAYIARSDAGHAAAAALAGDLAGRTVHTLTGPRAYSSREVADLVGGMFGRSIALVSITPEQRRQGMIDQGVPPIVAGIAAQSDETVAIGQLARVTGDFEALTGVAPQSFEDWLAANRAALTA